MSDEALFPHLRQPISIRGCEIPNRVVRSAHATLLSLGEVSDGLIGYHEARARGGVGLSVVEIMTVHPSSMGALPGFMDQVSPGLERLGERVHAHGKKVFQQLWHGGAHARHFDGGPAWAPSALPDPMEGRLPLAMTQGMIDEVVAGFASTARRCRDAGLDGVEVHAAHGYLVGAFLSPATNHRDDAYGGSVANRARFLEQVLAAIRAETGPDFPVGIRVSGAEGVPGGLEPSDSSAVVERLVQAGLTDYVSVSMGSYYAFPKFIGGMHEPPGYELPTSTPVVAAATGVPTMVVGRVTSLVQAERLVADGIADLVAMVRATIADPDLVNKSFDGRASEVRPCISCNQGCVGGLFGVTQEMGCAVNPDVGQEYAHPIAPASGGPRRVVVVGGGPAGLEAAHTAAVRGHDVVLLEASGHLGGQLRWASMAPHRADLAKITDWLAEQVDRLGVKVQLNTRATAASVEAEQADVVIVATGAQPDLTRPLRYRPGTPVVGLDLPHVLAPEQVLAGHHRHSGAAVVFDEIGDAVAPSVAEYLLGQGTEVVFATSALTVGSGLGPSLQRDPYHARLGAHPGFRALTEVTITAVTPEQVELIGLHDNRTHLVPADLMVLVTRGRPRRELFDELRERGIECHLVGDATEPVDLQLAIAAGRRVATAI